MSKEKIINVLSGKEYLIDSFVNQLYGSPHMWGWGPRLLIKGYSNFKIETKKEFFEKDYKTRIICDNFSQNILKKLNFLATSKKSDFSDVEKLVGEIKSGFLFNLGNIGARA